MRYNFKKIATNQGNNYTTVCLLDYNYFKNYYKMITIDFSTEQALDSDPQEMRQINFTRNLNLAEGATIFLLIKKLKETILDFSQKTMMILQMPF